MSKATVLSFPPTTPLKSPSRTFPLLTDEEHGSLPRPTWLIKHLILERGLTMLYGAAGSYKSFLAYDLAMHVSRGHTWQGHVVKRAQTLYIAGESDWSYVVRREGWQLHHQQPPVEKEWYRFCPTMPDVLGGELKLLGESLATEQFHPKFVIIDTLHNSYGGGDESSSGDFGKWWQLIREAFPSASVLVVHHTGHDTSKPRGTSAFVASCDAMYQAVKTEKPGHGHNTKVINLICKKQKDIDGDWSKDFALIPVELSADADGSPRDTLVLTAYVPPSAEKGAEGLTEGHMAVLRGLKMGGGHLGVTDLLALVEGIGKTAIYDRLHELANMGYVVNVKGKWRLEGPAMDVLAGEFTPGDIR